MSILTHIDTMDIAGLISVKLKLIYNLYLKCGILYTKTLF